MNCPTCGSADLNITREAYKYDESGLSNVTLVDIEIRRCSSCGEVMPVIPRLEELHRTIARAIVEQRCRLSPSEVRFLREYLGHSREAFANRIGVKRETLSRWENGKEQLGGIADRLLRMLVVQEKRVENYDSAALSQINGDDRQVPNFRVARAGSDWRLAAAA